MKRYLTESGGLSISDNSTRGCGVGPTAKVAADILFVARRQSPRNLEKRI
jgi:hypothetical protein